MALSAPACAEQWFDVSGADASTALAVDLDSIRAHDQNGEALVRVTHDVLHPHIAGFGYRSFVATAQFDCQRRSITLTSAAYYALPDGKGARLESDSATKEPGMPTALLL